MFLFWVAFFHELGICDAGQHDTTQNNRCGMIWHNTRQWEAKWHNTLLRHKIVTCDSLVLWTIMKPLFEI